MELNLQAITQANKAGSVSVSETVFDAKFNMALIHQAVTAYLAAARSGTKAQKNRAAVSGGGAKPWRQKGTGRARAGSSRSPLWRSGGTTFAASPTSYDQKLNKKMYRGAMRSILSELNRQQRLIAVDSFTVSAPKTRELVGSLKSVGLDKTLIIVEAEDQNLFLAARNLGWVSVLTVDEVDPVSLVGVEKVIISMPALKRLEEKLS